jgi:hypothetical protein
MSANNRQVGGSHYAAAIQHWDIVVKWHVPYLEAQVMKYVTRCHKKNKRQDLEKALHFAEKLHEVQRNYPMVWDAVAPSTGWSYARSILSGRMRFAEVDLDEYAMANDLDNAQRTICWLCMTGSDPGWLKKMVAKYLEHSYPSGDATGDYVDQGKDI